MKSSARIQSPQDSAEAEGLPANSLTWLSSGFGASWVPGCWTRASASCRVTRASPIISSGVTRDTQQLTRRQELLKTNLRSSRIPAALSLHWKSCRGFPGGASGGEPTCHCRRGKRGRVLSLGQEDPWRRKWQPAPGFLPGESPWTEEPVVAVHGIEKSRTRMKGLSMHWETSMMVQWLRVCLAMWETRV